MLGIGLSIVEISSEQDKILTLWGKTDVKSCNDKCHKTSSSLTI